MLCQSLRWSSSYNKGTEGWLWMSYMPKWVSHIVFMLCPCMGSAWIVFLTSYDCFVIILVHKGNGAASVVRTFMMCIKMKHLRFEEDMLRMFCIGWEESVLPHFWTSKREKKKLLTTQTDHATFLSARLAVSESVNIKWQSGFIKRGSTCLEVRGVWRVNIRL